MQTLRTRLILSHILPVLVIIPLMGIALVYIIETQVLLTSLSDDLASQARLVASLAEQQPSIWTDPAQAQSFASSVGRDLTARLILLSPAGDILASSDPADASRIGQPVAVPSGAAQEPGAVALSTAYNTYLSADIADATIAIRASDGHTVGYVRLTHQLVGIYQRFLRLRYVIAAVLAAGLFLGAAAGLVLAVTLERPLGQVTQAVYGLASGQPLSPLPEQGPQEIRMLLRAVNTLVERLTAMERNRRQLLANLVHELGRPLGAVRSAIQALQGGAADDAGLRQELLAGMDAEVQRLRRLIDDLARLRDQVTGTLELARKPVLLGDWLPRVLATWREAAHQKGIFWKTDIPSDLPELAIDPDRMAQAVGNLLSNAVKYTSTGGTITTSAGTTDEAAWIRVSDTGPGITAEERNLIFMPLYRGPQSRRFPQGMGLGLTIARELTEAHGGRIDVESTPGEGSEFTLWLPLSDHAVPQSSQA